MENNITTEDNFACLLFALLFFLLSIAAVDQFAGDAAQYLVIAVSLITPGIVIWSIRNQENRFRVGLGFIAALIAVALLGIFFGNVGLDVIYLLLLLGFFIMTTVITAQQVLSSGEVNTNKVVGGISIFLLLGLIWSILYLLLLEMDMKSFGNLNGFMWYENIFTLSYYSFGTLTTLGSGDISPALPLPRLLTYLEATMGLVYVIMMVVNLLGVRIHSNATKA